MKMFNGAEVASMLLVFMALVAGRPGQRGLRRWLAEPMTPDPIPGGCKRHRRGAAGPVADRGRAGPGAGQRAVLDLRWRQFLSLEALHSMGRFLGEFYPPDLSPGLLRQVLRPAGRRWPCPCSAPGWRPWPACCWPCRPAAACPASGPRARHALAAQRAALGARAGVGHAAADVGRAGAVCRHAGPGLHTAGVLGRLFAEALENAPSGPADALRSRAGGCRCSAPACRRCCRSG
jgi:hypothetical protein